MVEGRGKMIDEQAHHITRHIKGTFHFKSDLTKKHQNLFLWQESVIKRLLSFLELIRITAELFNGL